jgi:hypothetical protein
MEERSEDRLATQEIFGSKNDKPKQLEKMGISEVRPHDFLWERNICKGSLHVIAGPADSGKTKVSAWIASAVSGGGIPHWPDLSNVRKGLVVVCTTNSLDRSKFDLQLRALRSEADSIVYFDLESASHEENLRDLDGALQAFGRAPALIIFDGLPRIDRRLEAKAGLLYAQFARDYDCAVLITTTIDDKLASTPAAVVGRLAVCNSASVVFVISKISFSEDQQDEEEVSGLLRVKSTIGPRDEGFGFEIVTVQVEVNGGMIPIAVLQWNGTHIYGPLAKRKALQVTQKRYTQRQRAANFLRDALMRGPMRSDTVIRLGGQAQIPEDTLRRAATDVGVIRRSQPGISGGRGPDLWSLQGLDHLPEQSATAAGVSRWPVPTAPHLFPYAPNRTHTVYQPVQHPPVKNLFQEYAYTASSYLANRQPSSHVQPSPSGPSNHAWAGSLGQTAKVAEHWQPRQFSTHTAPMPHPRQTRPSSQTPIKDAFVAGYPPTSQNIATAHPVTRVQPAPPSTLDDRHVTTHVHTGQSASVQQPRHQTTWTTSREAVSPPLERARTENLSQGSQALNAVKKILVKKAMQAFEDPGK